LINDSTLATLFVHSGVLQMTRVSNFIFAIVICH
jgi:hypothetical protein